MPQIAPAYEDQLWIVMGSVLRWPVTLLWPSGHLAALAQLEKGSSVTLDIGTEEVDFVHVRLNICAGPVR